MLSLSSILQLCQNRATPKSSSKFWYIWIFQYEPPIGLAAFSSETFHGCHLPSLQRQLLEEKDRSAMEQALNSGTSDLPEVGVGLGAQKKTQLQLWKIVEENATENATSSAKCCWNQSQKITEEMVVFFCYLGFFTIQSEDYVLGFHQPTFLGCGPMCQASNVGSSPINEWMELGMYPKREERETTPRIGEYVDLIITIWLWLT